MNVAGEPGALKFRLELREEVRTSDGAGGFTAEWRGRGSLWASVRPVSARKVDRAGATPVEITHEVVVRKRAGIRAGMGFALAGRFMRIETVRDPDETGRFLLCLAREEA